MNFLMLVTAALQSVRAIAGNASLAESLGISKYSALIDSLLGTAVTVIGQGEAAYSQLLEFKERVDALRLRVESGERIPLADLEALKAESDALHAQMQALKGSDPQD